MKLYSYQESTPVLNLSTEDYVKYHRGIEHVATEGIGDFFYIIKDTLATSLDKLLGSHNDKFINDINHRKYTTLNKIKSLNFTDTKEIIVTKMEGFTGKYVEYSEDLLLSSTELVKDIYKPLSTLSVSIGTFINDYGSKAINNLYGETIFRESNKVTKKAMDRVSKYFKHSKGNTKAKIGDLIKSFSDMEPIYASVQSLDNILNEDILKEVKAKSMACSALVDNLVEYNLKTGVLLKNERVKKDLVEAIHISAKEIEALAYMYSNIVFYYGAVKHLCDGILEKG